MARIKYYYDTETCKYERVKVSKWDVFFNILGFFTVSLLMALSIVFIFTKYFDSPKEAQLRTENEELKFYYDLLSEETDRLYSMLEVLQDKDDNVYRVIFEAEPIPSTVRRAGVGGVDRYADLKKQGLEKGDLIISVLKKIDNLKKQMYIQTNSYDELFDLASRKEELLAAIPSIQPVNNKELNRLSSGYGMRPHPILKVKKFHPGIDFSAPQGTPVYATGDGKVREVKTLFGGYGKYIEIDHGFGYITLYAHLSGFEVRKGQNIKRGELIGYVGNTGQSTAPHLHYEVRKDGKVVNPINYFFKDLSPEEYEIILELAARETQSLS
jgi:murein DD-endopeptidase MepM/ murein hydrolase activator NlpD